ncbi:Bro-N domain-containing protein [Terasakiella pusilla]|uniref:BRO-N domain-containing protein n=1 Tax=Terasakiella pusilla TaxID=64973 RepID=UPI003AA82CB6
MGQDVLKVLDLKSPAYLRLEDDQKSLVSRTNLRMSGRGRPMMFINKAGLFRLIMRSDKTEAVKFQNWVTDTVLPSIMDDGFLGRTR